VNNATARVQTKKVAAPLQLPNGKSFFFNFIFIIYDNL